MNTSLFNSTNMNSSSLWNKSSSSTNPNYNCITRQNGFSHYNRRQGNRISKNSNKNNSISNINKSNGNYNILECCNRQNQFSTTDNRIECSIHPIYNISSQLQETLISSISTQQTKTCKVS